MILEDVDPNVDLFDDGDYIDDTDSDDTTTND